MGVWFSPAFKLGEEIVMAQCGVMFCIAEEHSKDGTNTHVDATGVSFKACIHGNLEHWDECRLCIEDAPATPNDEMPNFHVIL